MYHVVPHVIVHKHHSGVVADACVVHQNGDIVVGMGVLPSVEGGVGFVLVGDVEGQELGFSAGFFNEFFRFFGSLIVAQVVYQHGVAFLGKSHAYCTAYTARAASN